MTAAMKHRYRASRCVTLGTTALKELNASDNDMWTQNQVDDMRLRVKQVIECWNGVDEVLAGITPVDPEEAEE